MPAPTALQRAPAQLADQSSTATHPMALSNTPADAEVAVQRVDSTAEFANDSQGVILPSSISLGPSPDNVEDADMQIDSERPSFDPETAPVTVHKISQRKVPVPPHRLSPLKANWPKIYPPLVSHLKLQVRMNVKAKAVELRTSTKTSDSGALQKGADFIQAFTLGFDVDDAIALLRLDDLYIETFEIKDVKTLQGEHLSRAIGRIAGKDGKTKFAIENASRTRIVLADSKIHILGGFKNIHIAREAVVSLILGSPPGKVYGNLRTVASRMKERF